MVDCGRQEKSPGAFLLLTRHRAGLKSGGQLPSGSNYPIVVCFKSRFKNKNTCRNCSILLVNADIDYTCIAEAWQWFISNGGSGWNRL
jgi:hypothetical protein